MYELIPLSEHHYYIESPAKVGVVRLNDTEAVLIDSGSDTDAGKKILKILQAQSWELKAIFNTHYHADHVGGNAYLQEKTDCKIYAPSVEQGLIDHPIFEPTLLWGGNPPKELRHKFLMAQPSHTEPLTEALLPTGMHILPLPGHSHEMVGFQTDEGVTYLADALSSESTLNKYGIGFVSDVAVYLQTLELIKAMEGQCFVPSHAPVTSDIAPLAQINIDKTMEIGNAITELCQSPLSFENLLSALFARYGLTMTFEQYALVGSTLKSYLTWLKETDRLTAAIEENRLLWKSI